MNAVNDRDKHLKLIDLNHVILMKVVKVIERTNYILWSQLKDKVSTIRVKGVIGLLLREGALEN
jgi:hypothetical protein